MKTKWIRFWPWLLLIFMASCLFAMNVWCIPAHDELSYAFAGQNTPATGDVDRVSSLSDIVRQQYKDYLHGTNGRVFVHGIVAYFAGFKLYTLFDALNTAMWFLFVWLILHEGHASLKRDGKAFLFGACIVWWLLWYAETCCMNAAFAVNYLWTASATVAMMMLWRNMSRWWMVPIAFFYGWSQEVFVLPMLAAIAGGTLLRSLSERRLLLTVRQAVAGGLMLLGACFLCLGPAALDRASHTAGLGLSGLITACARANAGVVLLGAPMLLFGALGWVIWVNRKDLWQMLLRSPEWWCSLIAAYGLFCLTGSNGVVRLAMMVMISALILVIRERAAFQLRNGLRLSVIATALLWLLCVTTCQFFLYKNNLRMLRIYRDNPQGITAFSALPTGPMHYSVCHGIYHGWHRTLFRRELGHSRNPAFFTPWLYESLYLNPTLFFSEASELEATGLFVSPRAPRAVIMRGHEPPSASQKATLDRYFATLDIQATGWRQFIPGRFRVMFPDEDFYLAAPSKVFRFRAKDGAAYTLFLPPEKRN